MKKLVFATVLAIGSLNLATATTPIFHDGIMEEVMLQDFREISMADVPTAITTALENDFTGAVLNKAYVNDEDIYKLEASSEDGTSMVLYADAEGNWIEM